MKTMHKYMRRGNKISK